MIEGAECECGKRVVPNRVTCPKCGKNMATAKFNEKGSVLSHTALYAVPEGFEAPIKLAMIKLEEGPSLICGYEGDKDLEIGDSVFIKRKDALYFCEHTT